MASILVVDDSPIVRTLVAMSLSEEGHEVVEAVDGQEFLDITAGQDFDAILLDILMPNKSGVLALREFRERGGSTPVLIISSKTEASLVDAFAGCETGGHLLKPLTPQVLVDSIDGLLE